MPSPDKLFRLDPVSTDLTSPVTQVQIQKAADDSRATQQLYKGLKTFGDAIGSAADFAKKRRIKEDIKIAENAALRNEVLPGGLLPIAVESYNNVVDLNTSNSIYDELDLWSEGEEGEKLVSSNKLSTDAKITSLDNVFEDYWARASSTIQNPSVLLKFKTKLDDKKIELKKDIFKVEKDLMTVDVIQAVQNTINDAIKFMKKTGVTDFNQTFSKYWIKAMSKDIKNIFPDIDPSENKLLILHTLSTNPDILSNPSVIHDIMKSEYNKGITYNTLYAKGLLASNKDQDAKEIVKIFDNFITNSDTHLDAIEKAEKAQDKALEEESYNKAWDVFQQDPANIENAVDVLKRYGRPGKEVNTFRTMVEKYQNSEIKYKVGSPSYLAIRDLILNHKIRTKPEINEAILLGFLAPETKPFLEDFLSEEGNQITRNTEIYKERTATYNNTVISLMKRFLGSQVSSTDLDVDFETISQQELIRRYSNPDANLNPNELRTVLIGINELRFDIARQAEQLARQDAAAEGTGEVTEDGLNKIQQAMTAGIDAIIKGIANKLPEGKAEIGELPKLKVPTLLTLPSLAPKIEKELDVGEFTQLTEPTGKGVEYESIEDTTMSRLPVIELNQDDVNEMQKIVVKDKKQAKEMIEQLVVYENKLKEEERKELKSKRKATPKLSFKKSESKEETAQEAKEKLIVDAPLSKKDQAFLDKLKSKKDPTGAKKKEATPKVKTRAELLQENPKAAAILKRQKDFLADKDRDQKAVKEKPPRLLKVPPVLESDQVIANKQALFDHLDANQVPSKQQWTDLVEGISKETREQDKKDKGSILDDISSSFFNLTDMIFGGEESEVSPIEPTKIKETKEIKPSDVSPKEPSPDTTVPSRISDVGIKPFSPTLETFSEDFIGETDTRKGLRPLESKEPIEIKSETKSWDTKAGEAIIKQAKEFAKAAGDKISDNKADVIKYIREKRNQFRDFLTSSDQKKLDVIEKSRKRNTTLDDYVKLHSGATAIKEDSYRGAEDGVESLANMDSRILAFAKAFFDDLDLKDVWGPEKMITSGGRTESNKSYKDIFKNGTPEDIEKIKRSGHFDDGINKVIAMDIRINQDKWGRKRVPLIEKLGESAKKRGWTINLSKKGNKYALSDNKKEYWMKLSKGKEIRFIEVMSNHVHYHIDINHKEPENKW